MGYVPQERVCGVLTHEGRLAVTVSMELSALYRSRDEFVHAARQAAATSGVLVVYSQEPEQWAGQVSMASEALEAAGIPVAVVMATPTALARFDAVTGEVGPWSARVENAPVVVQAVVAGLSAPTQTREQVRAALQCSPERSAALAASARQEFNGEPIHDAVQALAEGSESLTTEAVRSIAAALMDRAAWAQWFEDHDARSAAAELPVWSALATYYADQQGSVRDELEGERVLTALGFTGWLAGNGMVMVEVLGRLDRRDSAGLMTSPDVELERAMIRCAVQLSVPPSKWLNRR